MKKLFFIIPLLFIGITYAAPTSDDTRAIEHFELFNTYRVSNGLNALTWDDGLAECIKNYLILQINNNFE